MLRAFVSRQVARTRAQGADRHTTREAFRAMLGAGMLALHKAAGHTELGAAAFARGVDEYMPEALRIFDAEWPAS